MSLFVLDRPFSPNQITPELLAVDMCGRILLVGLRPMKIRSPNFRLCPFDHLNNTGQICSLKPICSREVSSSVTRLTHRINLLITSVVRIGQAINRTRWPQAFTTTTTRVGSMVLASLPKVVGTSQFTAKISPTCTPVCKHRYLNRVHYMVGFMWLWLTITLSLIVGGVLHTLCKYSRELAQQCTTTTR